MAHDSSILDRKIFRPGLLPHLPVVRGIGALSPAGIDADSRLAALEEKRKCFVLSDEELPCGRLPAASAAEICSFNADRKWAAEVDRTVVLACLAARGALGEAAHRPDRSGRPDDRVGVAIGSSRGATGIWEDRFAEFCRAGAASLSPKTSPLTTLGNISSWVAQDLQLSGFVTSHSMTCSTGLHAVCQAAVWLGAGRLRWFLTGAAEAPLTPFTFAQMQALKIYSRDNESGYPCRPFQAVIPGAKAANTFVLSEGSGVCLLEGVEVPEPGDIVVESFGCAQEQIPSATGLSADGAALREAMLECLENATLPGAVDVVFAHAPGTVQGDAAERQALSAVFGDRLPRVAAHKWLVGHSFAASAMLAFECAVELLRRFHGQSPEYVDELLTPPYAVDLPEGGGRVRNRDLRKIMINATGFGGNAVSVLLARV